MMSRMQVDLSRGVAADDATQAFADSWIEASTLPGEGFLDLSTQKFHRIHDQKSLDLSLSETVSRVKLSATQCFVDVGLK
jgi:hypothetical protein